MKKALIILIIAVAAGYFLHNYMNREASEEEDLVAGVRARYVEAVNKFLKAGRMAGGLGLDSTLDSEAAVNEVLKARAELTALRKGLTEPKAIRKAEALAEKIEEFCRKNDII